MNRLAHPVLCPLVIVCLLLGATAPCGADETDDDRYPEDITYFLPAGLYWFSTLAVDPRNGDVAYMGTHEGQVYRTRDGGKTWEEFELVPEMKRMYQSMGERFYAGRVRTGDTLVRPGVPDLANDRDLELFQSKSSDDEMWGGGGEWYLNELPRRFSLEWKPATKPFHQSMLVEPGIKYSKRIRTSIDKATDLGGRHGGAHRSVLGTAQFGLGLGGGSPRLAAWAWRKTGKPFGGRMNLQQLLKVRSRMAIRVWKIVISPHSSDVVFACTAYGLFKSIDSGNNWVRTFVGINPFETNAKHLAIDPKNPDNVLLGTGNGLYISRDGGENWKKSPSQAVGGGWDNWIQYDQQDPRYVYIATSNGLVRSRDGGRNWEWIYYTTFPTARDTQAFDIDPADPNTGYLGTRDGLFVSRNIREGGLEDWKRVAGLKFTGIWVERVIAAGPGHVYITTRQLIGYPFMPFGSNFVMETRDGGESWKILDSQHNPSEIMHLELDPRDPDLLWILWSRTLHRLRHRNPEVRLPDDDALGEILSQDPPLHDVLMAAYRHCGVEIGQQLEVRSRAGLAALMPRIEGFFSYSRSPLASLSHDYRTQFMDLPYWQRTYPNIKAGPHYGVMLTWDLSPLVFRLEETLFGRVTGVNHDVLTSLQQSSTRDYQELMQLKAKLKTEPPEDPLLVIMYMTRIEELTAMLDVLTGGYVTTWKEHRKSGLEVERGM